MTLKSARVNAGLTMKEASNLIGVHHQTISKYEKDSSDIPLSLLHRMSEIYRMPIDNIFLGIEYEKNSTYE
ncbi:helix-turn-helix transcriptional regulator [Aerococcaceae bacterium zg-ZUI334]|uniref:helix-turn-helix transcriptional regulator n=1 Tax=Aerococcaceae bacterium zg-252 TaxID=2796928 RepID=UPI001B905241|nr:helix-turn-helix transcriptional regulator [Aerococcaceae bacterium zg-ZUI334]